MELKAKKREAVRKGETKQIRREGGIPAVLYGVHRESESIAIDRAEFEAHLRSIKKGELATSRFHLKGEGVDCEAIVKDIHYHPTTYDILHLDFEALEKGVEVKLNVPIEFTGVADCAGIKLGGVLRPVIRSLRVRCTPENLPARFTLDVRELLLRQTKRLRDIDLPKGVTPLGKMDEVAVVIAKR